MLLDEDDQDKALMLASVSVQTRRMQARRMQGMDEEAIRKDALAFASKQIGENIDDPIEQESWLIEIAKNIDAEIERTRGLPCPADVMSIPRRKRKRS